jgi:serine/threonine-protein kinase
MDPRTIGERYELRDRMGSGGMGTVWRAHDRSLGRDVAVKLLHEGLASDTTFAQRFRGEARAAARLTHPNIVAVFDTGERDGIPFIVMELVAGPSLHTILSRHGPLPITETARIGRAITSALAHAHGRGLIHRDMKPANVLIEDASREPKVADFGIAKGLEDSAGLTRTGGLIGTAAYLSPEQVSGRPATPASDLYAVGCMLYACLVGEPPFGGGQTPQTPVAVAMRHLHDPVPPLRDRRPDVPEDLAAVVHRALSKDPAQRFASAAEMERAIVDTGLALGPAADLAAAPTVPVRGTAPTPVRTQTQAIDRPPPPRPRAVRVLATVSALLIAAAVIWLTATYFANRRPLVDQQFPSQAPTLAPSTPTPAPSPSPTRAPGGGDTDGGTGFPLCGLPGLGDCPKKR